jgi:transposase
MVTLFLQKELALMGGGAGEFYVSLSLKKGRCLYLSLHLGFSTLSDQAVHTNPTIQGYDSDELIAWLKPRGIHAVIPPRKNRLRPQPIDPHRYKARNLVERTFHWIKHFRRVATRFEKLDIHYAAMVSISCICKCLA